MRHRLVRQSFLGTDSDTVLGRARVGIVGLGGGGAHVAQQLAHLGVGNFVLVDPDVVEESNLNRLVGATARDAQRRTSKVVVATRVIRGVNPNAIVTSFQHQWQDEPAALRDCCVVFGCVDSFREREQLEIAARRYLIPYLDIGMDVHPIGEEFCISGQAVLSMPGERCMRCFGIINEEALAREAGQYSAAGARPQVIWPNAILASTAVGLFVQLVTPWHKKPVASAYLEYDGNTHTIAPSHRLTLVPDHRCKHFDDINNTGDPWWTPQPNMKSPSPQPSWLSKLRRHLTS